MVMALFVLSEKHGDFLMLKLLIIIGKLCCKISESTLMCFFFPIPLPCGLEISVAWHSSKQKKCHVAVTIVFHSFCTGDSKLIFEFFGVSLLCYFALILCFLCFLIGSCKP